MLPILTHALRAPIARHARTGLVVGTAATLFLGMVAAFGTTAETPTYSGTFTQVVDEIPLDAVITLPAEQVAHAREIRVQRGDSVTSLLSRLGMRDSDALAFLRSNTETDVIFRQLAPGKALTAQVTSEGALESLTFPLNGPNDDALIVTRTGNGFNARTYGLDFDTHNVLQSAEIVHSLFGAADEAGIPESVAVQLAEIFGGDIDFHRDLRKGDRLSVIYEAANYLGRPARAQRILAAEFINDGKPYRAFWFQDDNGNGGYYTEDGRSVKKAFLRSPLEFSRITSGFSLARYHPVLRETRAHRGIDYGAPTGTRVRTTGDGVVDFVGTQGGYGKVVRIRHPGNKTTLYGHLSGFAAGMKKGTRVAQGDVIGFVGATGLATGPHLHYEFQVAGIHRNPLTITLPNAAPLHASRLGRFTKQVSDYVAQISAIRHMQFARLD